MYSYVTYTGNGVQTAFAVPFPYISQDHVEVSVDGESAAYTWLNASTVTISPAPAADAEIIVRRNSSRATRLVDYADGATLDEGTLDRDSRQTFYVAQEALDQNTIGSSFDTDAHGARVVNVADPVGNTDAATKQWVEALVEANTTAGLDLRPLDNTWTGDNEFTEPVTIGDAVLDPAETATKDRLAVNKALFSNWTTAHVSEIGFGFVSRVKRETGVPHVIGGQFLAFTLGTNACSAYGFGGEAWKGQTATGYANGMRAGVTNLNGNDGDSERVGLDVVFKNREELATGGGNASNELGVGSLGTAANKYNANAWAIQIDGQGRSDSNATYVGWGRGIRFRDNWCDLSKVPAYSGARAYKPGDYATSGGVIYQNILSSTNVSPPNATYWTVVGAGTDIQAIGIDFSGVSATTASRMKGAIKLRGEMKILWDTEGLISTAFYPSVGRWVIENNGAEWFGVEPSTGDLFVAQNRRILGTRSSFSAHRNGSPLVIGFSTFTNVGCSTENWDYRGEYNAGIGRFQPNVAGDYMVIAQFETDGTAAEGQWVNGTVFKNGVAQRGSSIRCKAGQNTVQVQCVVQMNGTTDYIDFQAWTADVSLVITGEPTATFFQAYRLA